MFLVYLRTPDQIFYLQPWLGLPEPPDFTTSRSTAARIPDFDHLEHVLTELQSLQFGLRLVYSQPPFLYTVVLWTGAQNFWLAAWPCDLADPPWESYEGGAYPFPNPAAAANAVKTLSLNGHGLQPVGTLHTQICRPSNYPVFPF